MTLTSLSFYLLVLALLVLYYLVPKRFQWVVLLIGSYAFYAFVCLRYMGFIVITTLTTYFGARGMDAMTARMEQTVAAHKQDWERDERKAYKALQIPPQGTHDRHPGVQLRHPCRAEIL